MDKEEKKLIVEIVILVLLILGFYLLGSWFFLILWLASGTFETTLLDTFNTLNTVDQLLGSGTIGLLFFLPFLAYFATVLAIIDLKKIIKKLNQKRRNN